jgi:predicted nucleic acid-binding protein
VKVFLDANILFSAADPESATRKLLLKVLEAGEAVTSFHAVEEARRNLECKRPASLPGFADVMKLVRITLAFSAVRVEGVPEHDMPIIAAAVGERCTHLWTSDKRHFGRLYGTAVNGVLIVSGVMLLNA